MDSTLREHLIELLEEGKAHATFEQSVNKMAVEFQGVMPENQPHTPWRLVEHMRITQNDILEFSKDATHKSPKWPDEYWPEDNAPPDDQAWDECLESYRADRKEMISLIRDKKSDLLKVLPHGEGQTLAREAMLLADHTAYHVAQLILIRRLMGKWHAD